MYEKKFGYVFVTCASGKSSEDILAELKMCFTNKHAVELDIALQEEMKFIELQITELLSKKSAQIVNDGDEIDSTDNQDDISSTGIDMSMQLDLNKVSKEDNITLDDQQVEDDFGDDLSDPMSCEASRFLTEYFWPGQYDIDEEN
ncbi:hypothetical protein Ahy_A04g019449 [Arachis hypogaea]|uniref:2-oxo-4-hydroxy-4-carboxy-5-ureidoimidazoline decarboxylase n=1 Tax=Arachis hypogaea TaxID=3818 RepID=A0A445DFX3_ARAHY|nr:hypothetical protein Ahy_A04g019449 [Arachis hypogaea]